jgi:hypothetical protein
LNEMNLGRQPVSEGVWQREREGRERRTVELVRLEVVVDAEAPILGLVHCFLVVNAKMGAVKYSWKN